MRWHALREEKLKASGILDKLKKSEECIDRLCEERVQVELDQKVHLVLNLSYLQTYTAVQFSIFMYCSNAFGGMFLLAYMTFS